MDSSLVKAYLALCLLLPAIRAGKNDKETVAWVISLSKNLSDVLPDRHFLRKISEGDFSDQWYECLVEHKDSICNELHIIETVYKMKQSREARDAEFELDASSYRKVS